ncbi:MAG TPA: hypothetical protein VLA37_08865 [Sphingomonadaceae bacterium]|nr:hypothetical protein [Sphingomonadaceae bacterium]
MSIQFSKLVAEVAADGTIADEELSALRQLGWGDGSIYREEAEALFLLNRDLKEKSPEWVDFFVEALGEFVINGTDPRGYVDEEDAAWLVDELDHDGKLESMAELELLVRVIERAENVPDMLKHYALRQVERAVLSGTGPTRDGGELSDTHISDAEVEILRRIVFACGGHGPAAVSRFDAELLFRLKDRTLGQANSAKWKDLFVKGVGNYLLGFTLPNAQLSQQRMLELQAFIADNKADVGRFFGEMVREAPKLANHFGKVFGQKPAQQTAYGRMGSGQIVTDDERNWLDSQIDANGEVDEFDRALLEYLASELPEA